MIIDFWMGMLVNFAFMLTMVGIALAFLLVRRKSLLSLFGISKPDGLSIFLSCLHVREGGAHGVAGLPMSYREEAVSVMESSEAGRISRLFEFIIPGLEAQPGFFNTLLTRDIPTSIVPSPREFLPRSITGAIVTIGSPGFNTVSMWAESLDPIIRFSENNAGFVTETGALIEDPSIGMVQVLFDSRSKRRVFYLAGTTQAGTFAAILYLSTKWKELARHMKGRHVGCFLVKIVGNVAVLEQQRF